jgi:glycosyltransferase involved in cell wall biosynthesis
LTERRLLTFERRDTQPDVLILTNGWPTVENKTYCVFVRRQVESLVEHGLRCDVLFARGYRSPLAYVLLAARLAGWSILGGRQYRVVHAHGGETALFASFYRRAPLLFSYLGDDLLGTPDAAGVVPRVSRIRRGVVRQHSRLASWTITKSFEMAVALPKTVRMRNSVVPNGVDVDLFRPIDRAQAREELGWDANSRIALFAANPDVPRKRHWLATAACERAAERLPDVRLEVAVDVTPDRMPLLMSAADCLLITSSIEGSPNVVKEALMCNLPVVATPAGDIAELLDRVEPSWLCEPTEIALAEALVECLSAPCRSNGRQLSSRLDAKKVAGTLFEIYERLAPGTFPHAESRVRNPAVGSEAPPSQGELTTEL